MVPSLPATLIRLAVSRGQGTLPGTFPGLSPAPNTKPGKRHVTNARGMKNQTCHCTNETKTQTAVGRDSILLAFTIPALTPPSQNSQEAPPCSGILQVAEPALPLALSPSVTCSMVSSGGQARNKSRKWLVASSRSGTGPLRAQLESRHCPFLSGQSGQVG